MSKRLALVDYGMGNLRSVSQALQHAAAQSGQAWRIDITGSPDVVRAADKVVLPGQGAMPDCMREFDRSGLRQAVQEALSQKPLLGICVGMQMLFDRSEEGPAEGLGVLPGTVRRFDLDGLRQPDGSRYKVPQMGWNRVWPTQTHPLWAGIDAGAHFYFVHSYYADPADPAAVAARTPYGLDFCSAVAHGPCFATQFHPEKSARAGLRLMQNFLSWSP